MKNYIRTIVFCLALPAMVSAQTAQDADLNAQLDKLYQEQTAKNSQVESTDLSNEAQQAQGAAAQIPGTQVNVNVQAQPQATANQVSQAELGLVQKQDTTVIQDSPLTESRAEQIRRARQDAELLTEQTIVEKLEESRMEDEKRRAEALFGGKLNQIQSPAATQQQQNASQTTVVNGPATVTPVLVQEQQAVQAPIIAAPVVAAPVVVESAADRVDPELEREMLRSEISAALSDMKETTEPETPADRTYVSALLGMGEYPDAINVRGQYSLGVSVGRRFQDRFVLEGTFLYSNFQVEQMFLPSGCYGYQCYPVITDLNQYNGAVAAKYQLLSGVIRPNFGGVVSYTYRTYSDKQFAWGNSTSKSHAFDLGLTTGVDFEFDKTFSIGMDFKYLWNLSYRVDNALQTSFVQPQFQSAYPLEELSYYMLSVVGKISF